MKFVCDDKESEKVCQIMNEFDTHNETYIKVSHVELSKGNVSRRKYVGAPLEVTEVDCLKIRGSSKWAYNKISTGTRYVYFGEELYNEIYKWYNTKLRENKLENLFK